MSDHNLCHGPQCHKQHTQDRIRGVKGSKVLRTKKIKHNSNYRSHDRYSMFNYFCGQNCLMDFIRTHITSIIAIAPRREALETPIKVEKTKEESYRTKWNDNGDYQRVPYMATRTTIKSVDND